MNQLIQKIRQWGEDRNIIGPNAKATVKTQFEKLREEFTELEDAIADNNQHELIDAVGDCTVVLIILAELAGTSFETCLQAAYDEIKDRQGKMVNGTFEKSERSAEKRYFIHMDKPENKWIVENNRVWITNEEKALRESCLTLSWLESRKDIIVETDKDGKPL